MPMNIQRKTSNIANIIVYDASGNIVLPAGLTVTGLNTAGYVKSNASGVFSISATVTGSDVTGAALTKTDDTNVTLTLGGTPATSLLRAASLTLGWTGQLAVSRGGTGLSALGTANQLIRVNAGATALEYFTPTYLTANQSITLSGDVSGSGTTAITTTLATVTQSTGANFVKITLDTKGRVTGNTAVASGDITTALGYTPYNSTNPSGYTSNTGTVTTVSVTTANGVSGTVATATTTPAITITLGAITPTSVNSVVLSGSATPTLAVTGTSSISGSNTGDNAVNSLYSGLVSNATHTGDATGATALTVVGLRSVALPALGASAGFLRYTGTGTNTWVFDTATYITGNESISVSGDATGSGTTAIALTLATVNSNIGTFNNVTVNAKGLVTAASSVAYITGNQSITLSGDVSGTGTTAITATLATVTQSTGASFVKITLDTKGRVTGNTAVAASDLHTTFGSQTTNTFYAAPNGAAGNPSFRAIVAADIPTLNQNTTGSAGSVANAVTFTTTGGAAAGTTYNGSAARTIDFSTVGAAAASHNQAWSTITSTPTTISGYGITDAYTKTEVDSFLQGLDPKASVKAATTANITLSAPQTVDGVALVAGDRVLVKDQSTASQNGIYVVAAAAWTRSTDLDLAAEFPGAYTFVEQGTVNADRGYVCTNDTVTVGTTNITFVQFTGSGAYQATLNGTGFVRMSGTTVSYITGTASQFVKADGTLDSSVYITGNQSITVSGDASGTGTTAIALTLATVNSNIGTFNNVTVNAKGLVTAASNVSYLTGNQNISITGDVSGSGTTAISTTLATITQSTGSSFVKITLDTKGRVTGNTTVAASDLNSTFGSQTANTFYAAPNGAAGNPAFRAIVAADIPALNYQAPLNGTGFVKASGTTISYDNSTYALSSHTHSYFIGTTAVQTSSANQALTGITGITFAAEASDAASITTTISSTSTFFDFNLADDNNNDEWRWRFSPSGGTVYNAMRLVPVSNTASNLTVSGTISSSNFSGSSSGTNTGDQTLSGLGGQAQLNGTGFVKASGTTISYDNSTYYLASNPSGYTTNTGTVTSVGGTGTVSGLTLSGTVTTSGNLTLGGTLSASIDNITDEHRLFNNMGDNHGTRSSFDATIPTYNFGWRYIQGTGNGPGVNSATQYYSVYVGLGNDYPATGAGSYGMQIAFPRNVSNPYIAIRYNENNGLAAWQKISAGYADTAGALTSMNISQFTNNSGYLTGITSGQVTTALGYTPYNSTNPNGYTSNTGTVTSVSGTGTVSGLTLSGTVTTSGSLTLGGTLSLTAANVNAVGAITNNTSGTAGSTAVLTASGALTTQQGSGTVIYSYALTNPQTGLFAATDNANSILTVNRHPGDYYSQLGFSSNGNLYYRNFVNTAINTSQAWQTIWTSSSLTNLNQLTNGPGYITGYSETDTLATVTSRGSSTTAGILVNGLVTASGLANTGNSGGNALVLPAGGSYYAGSSSNTGAIAITLPKGMGNAMIRMTIKIYQYSTGNSFEVNCGGYMYPPGNTWANNPFAYIVAQPGYSNNWTVRFGYTAAGKGVIYIGETTSTWSYLGIHVTDVQVSYSDTNMSVWNSGWTIGYATSFENVTATQSNTQVGMFLDGYARNQTGGVNTIVQRDANGYIQNNYFYTSGGGSERNASGMGYFAGFNSSDYYIRSYTPAAVAAALGLGSMAYASTASYYNASTSDGRYAYVAGSNASGTWNINVLGNASSATTTPLVSVDNAVVYGRSGLQFAQSSGTAGNTASSHQTPTGDWWHVIRMNHANNAGYYADLAVSMTTNLGLARRVISAGSQLSNWVTILDALNYSSYSTFSATVISGGNNGFVNDVYSAGVRNPIWRFGNAVDYGISYFQGTSGIGSADTIGIHPNGTATATGSAFSVTSTNSYVNNQIVLHAGNYNNYAPTKTGGGASGSWGIDITGTATYGRYAYNNGAYSGTGWVEPSDLGVRYANSSAYSGYLSTLYAGGQQLNPQTYFAQSIGLRVAMTAAVGVWSDTLWINGYSGNDVLQMCAIHTQRNGTPRMYISAQASNATSYGTAYEVVTNYNSPYALAMNQYVRTTDGPTFTNIYNSGWFRNNNNNEGLYNQNTTQHWSSKDNGYWDASSTNTVSSIRFWTGGHVSALRGYVYANNSNELGFLDSAGSWIIRTVGTANTYLTGTFTATGDVIAYSDARIKTNIQTIDNALEKVTSMRGVTYNRTDVDDQSTKVGVIAQEMEQVLPEVVTKDDAGMLGVSYGNLAGVFIEAFKEQQRQIEELKKQIEFLAENSK